MKCANPNCKAEGLYLRSGSVYTIDYAVADSEGAGPSVARKIVWLCESCTKRFAVERWRPAGQQLQPRSKESAPLLKMPVPRFEMRLGAQRLAS